jgi:aspartate/methionine/tyrosine aminotransferase
VLYGEPADPVYEIGALFAEAWTYAVPLAAANGYRMDPDLVPESVLRRAAVVHLNSPHDPTGQCLPDALFAAWVAARDRYGFTLVGDEGHADLWYAEPRPRSLLEFGRKGCVAVHSLSARSAMAGFRSGFVAGDAEVLATYSRYRTAMGTAPQDFVQVAAAAAWRDTAHVEARRLLCGEKRRIVLDLLAARGLRVLPATASLFLWVEVPQGQTDVAYAERCAEKGILVAPGSYFGRGQERFVRVALGPTIEDCRAAADLWPR